MKIKIIRTGKEFEALAPAWREVLESSDRPSVPRSWEWASAWLAEYGHNRRLWLICGYEGGHLVAIAALTLTRKPIRRAKVLPYRSAWLIGSGPTQEPGILSEYLDLVIEEGREEEFIQLFCRTLSENREWEEIVLENVSENSTTSMLLKAAAREVGLIYEERLRVPSHLIRLPESWNDYLASLSRSTRYKINRGRRELEKAGGRFRAVESLAELEKILPELVALHQARWENRGQPGAFSMGARRRFHQRLMPALLQHGCLLLRFLEIQGQVLAINYNFGLNGRVHYFQSGMKPHENRNLRPGLILHSYCIEEAIESGGKEYDFLMQGRGGAGYKEMWSNYSRDLLCLRLARPSVKESLLRKSRGLVDRASRKGKI